MMYLTLISLHSLELLLPIAWFHFSVLALSLLLFPILCSLYSTLSNLPPPLNVSYLLQHSRYPVSLFLCFFVLPTPPYLLGAFIPSPVPFSTSSLVRSSTLHSSTRLDSTSTPRSQTTVCIILNQLYSNAAPPVEEPKHM